MWCHQAGCDVIRCVIKVIQLFSFISAVLPYNASELQKLKEKAEEDSDSEWVHVNSILKNNPITDVYLSLVTGGYINAQTSMLLQFVVVK